MEWLRRQIKVLLGADPIFSLPRVARVTLGTGTDVGDLLSWQNTLRYDVLAYITLDITTDSSATETADIGVDDDGADSDDTLIDGLALDGGAGVFNSFLNGGTNGIGIVKVPAGSYIVGTNSGTATALVGKAYITYWPLQP